MGIIVALLFFSMLITSCDSAVNHKPFIDDSNSIVIRIPEDTAVGTPIVNITATDQENDDITFGLDSNGATLFTIRNVNTRMGELSLKKELNRELVSSYDFHVTVTDGGADRETSKQFSLQVSDVNDNKPVFVQQPYWTSIPENTTVGTTLLTIQATDADLGTNAAITYRFSNDSSSAQTSKFAIDINTGVITLVSSLDYEITTRYLLPVVAEDGGNPRQESTTTVVIDVKDISDNPPKFEQSVYLKEIEENAPVGQTVVTVVARDGDAGINNPLKYEIYSGNDGTFAIGSSTGVITVNNTINAEKTQSYKLFVRASEVPDPSSNSTVSVLITVIDKNDNPPVFSQDSYSFTLRENLAKPGRIVTDELIVRDADKNPEFRHLAYHLTGRDSDRFVIDASSGELKINSTLDYETQVKYTFTVVATETETAEKYSDNATIHLTLINDNDNKPIFANASYYYTLDEEVPPGKEIAVITATDADFGSFGQVTYELRGSQSSFFAVDSNTGNITAARTLDYEQVHSYQFYLIASDGGGVYKEETTATINVNLRDDVNDNDPEFTATPYTNNTKVVNEISTTSISTPVPKYRESYSLENALLIVVGILVLIIIFLVASGMCYLRRITIRKESVRQTVDRSGDGQRNDGLEETLQMQDAVYYSGISANMDQQPPHVPNYQGPPQEPQYADLNQSTILPLSFYQGLSPSSQNISQADVNETVNSSSNVPALSYEKLQHDNGVQLVYLKRNDLNDELAPPTPAEYEIVA